MDPVLDGNGGGMTGKRPMDPNTRTPERTGAGMGAAPLLEVEDLHVTIQAMEALRGLSVRMASGSMVGLIGRNGAGKTTLMRTVMGHLKPARGRIVFEGRDLAAAATHARAAFGIGYMPEDRQLVPQLTVEENILLPIWVSKSLQARPRLDFVYGVMPELAEMRERKALLLSGGQQKLVALGRALAVGTRLLLLDEPFEGVAPALSQRLSEVIGGLRGTALGVVITQSDLNHSRTLFDHEYVIERGANGPARHAA
jgi:branched-chain amino acid transport system ATP-binding protein